METSIEKIATSGEVATLLSNFAECSSEIQNIVLEMAAILTDGGSSDDDRRAAYDAIVEALLPGETADILDRFNNRLKAPDARETADELKREQELFADRVRTAMKLRGITQEDLAAKAGIGQPAVSNILNRHCRPQRKTVIRFAEILGMQPEELWPEISDIGKSA
jgi:lambda repressor-like predicted transcriptional regulator